MKKKCKWYFELIYVEQLIQLYSNDITVGTI